MNFISNLSYENLGYLNSHNYKISLSNACRLLHVYKVGDNEAWKWSNLPHRMAYIKYPFNGDPSERQKNRHHPISVIYDSRKLSSVTNSRRIKYGGWKEMRMEKSEKGEIKKRGLHKKRGGESVVSRDNGLLKHLHHHWRWITACAAKSVRPARYIPMEGIIFRTGTVDEWKSVSFCPVY